ncbi:MAG: ornithine carbamoyltransferase, partial [Limnochordia bacterium]
MESKDLIPASLAHLGGRDFLTLASFTREELSGFLRLAQRVKELQKGGIPHPLLAGKTLGLIFQKASTRTRVSFEVGIYQLGGHGLFLSSADLQLGRGETIADTAQVLARYLDGIMIRTFAQEDVEELAHYSTVPVINGLTDLLHPCQALGDYFTMWERWGDLAGRRVVYVGDGNNMAHSLMLGGAIFGVHVVVISPPGYQPAAAITDRSRQLAAKWGGEITVTADIHAVAGADVIYTDVWASMGQEAEQEVREEALRPYQVNSSL